MDDLKEIILEDNLKKEILKNWRPYKDKIIADDSLLEFLVFEDYSAFTELVKENPDVMTVSLAELVTVRCLSQGHSNKDYYYTLRIIGTMVKSDAFIFSIINSEYKDEMFTREAYKSNAEVYKYFSKLEKIYVSDGWFAKKICAVIQYINVIKAGILYGNN